LLSVNLVRAIHSGQVLPTAFLKNQSKHENKISQRWRKRVQSVQWRGSWRITRHLGSRMLRSFRLKRASDPYYHRRNQDVRFLIKPAGRSRSTN